MIRGEAEGDAGERLGHSGNINQLYMISCQINRDNYTTCHCLTLRYHLRLPRRESRFQPQLADLIQNPTDVVIQTV